MACSRFRVKGNFGPGLYEATVIIDRGSGLFTVRPLHRRTAYTLPLSTVAEHVVWRCAKAEAEAKRRERAAVRRAVR